MYDYLIVGAGFSGSVIAERLASQLNKKVIVVEKRSHIAGNAYDEYDEHGILVHRYGPHIFHTNNKEVLLYLSQFTEWRFYEHKVLAKLGNEDYPFPINRLTLNKFFKINLQSEQEAADFYSRKRENRYPVLNSEDIIVNQAGIDLFNSFFRNYTTKQWGFEPVELEPSVCGRIPVRTNDDCRYFGDEFQFMPKEGYTKMFERILNHKNINVVLNTDYKSIITDIKFNKLIYTGPVDYFFDFEFGRLPYRSIRFEYENIKTKYYQDCAQVNYMDGYDFTRIVEHKYLSGQKLPLTTISREYPEDQGEPFYPVPNESNRLLYKKYQKKAESLESVYFLGRLAEYQYYNMDQVVYNALHTLKSL